MSESTREFAVITGAGSGLGRAMAIELVRKGVRVAGFGRSIDPLLETARIAGPGFEPCVVDVSSPQEVDGAMERLAREFAPVTILINNAVVRPHRDFLDETPQSFMDSVSINLGGVVNCSHAALKQMVQTGYGRILNVSTFADVFPMPASSAFAVSKGAARIFTKALRADIEDRFPGIIINDWMPGAHPAQWGIPEGVSLDTAARWGVELALWKDASLRGTVWECDTEHLPHRSLKGRLKDKLLRRNPTARRLGTACLR